VLSLVLLLEEYRCKKEAGAGPEDYVFHVGGQPMDDRQLLRNVLRLAAKRWASTFLGSDGTQTVSAAVHAKDGMDIEPGFPVLEIPQWMFEAAECCRIAVSSGIIVRCEALRHLRALLAEAPQSSWIAGGADAEVVETERRSGESVPSADPQSGVAAGSEPKDGESTGANAEGTRRKRPGSTERGRAMSDKIRPQHLGRKAIL